MPSFVRATVASGLLLAAALIPAAAQDFSGKPIRMIVPFSAGGGTDISARLIGQKLGETLKTSVIVENKAGGNLIPAGKEVAGATPDGHTLYFISTSALITQSLSPDYPLDLSKFAAVSEVSVGPLILAVRNDLGVKTFRDVVDLAKKNPGKLKFASAGGTSTSLYLATELFRLTTGVNITIVPYKGSAPALNDLLGGHIDAMFDFMPLMSGQVKTGKVTPIGVTGAKRSPALPDVPTIRETGVQYRDHRLVRHPGTSRHADRHRAEAARRGGQGHRSAGHSRQARPAGHGAARHPARRFREIHAVGAGVLYQAHQGGGHQAGAAIGSRHLRRDGARLRSRSLSAPS